MDPEHDDSVAEGISTSDTGSEALQGVVRCVVQADSDDLGDTSQVSVGSQQRRPMSVRYRGDDAVDHSARSEASSTEDWLLVPSPLRLKVRVHVRPVEKPSRTATAWDLSR